jgi:ribosomal small subunit protein bTHX
MGRGDKRTRKGKIFRGSYGRTRPKSEGKPKPPRPGAQAAAPRPSAGR